MTTATSRVEHLKDASGRCLDGCYACERRGLQERIRFTAPYESLVLALTQIAESNEECGCDHTTDSCCNQAGVFCARCIAAAALLLTRAQPAVNAVDPQALSTGKPSQRDEGVF